MKLSSSHKLPALRVMGALFEERDKTNGVDYQMRAGQNDQTGVQQNQARRIVQ